MMRSAILRSRGGHRHCRLARYRRHFRRSTSGAST